jgi:hypothetical protein
MQPTRPQGKEPKLGRHNGCNRVGCIVKTIDKVKTKDRTIIITTMSTYSEF